MGGRRRPNYPLVLTTGLTIHRDLSAAAKLYLAAAAALPGHDPGLRLLDALLPFDDATLSRAAAELERLGLARVMRRPGRRLRLEPMGLAAPGAAGRNRYATIPAQLVQAVLDAVGGRRAGDALLVVQRLLRDQHRRGVAQAPAPVIAADLAIKSVLAMKLLAELHAARLVERRKAHADDSADLPVLAVPLAGDLYPIEPGRLDPEQTRLLERIEVGDQGIVVLGPRGDLTKLATLLPELRAETPPDVLAAAVASLIAGNLTGETFLAEDLLPALRGTLERDSRDTSPPIPGTLERDPRDTSKTKTQTQKMRYADGPNNGAATLDAGRAGRGENQSSDEEEGQPAAASTARPGTQRYEAPYCPTVSYTARRETHERIAALLNELAARYDDGEAREAAYQAVLVATAEWTRGAKGSNVLAWLNRRWRPEPDEPDGPTVELDFGAIGEAAA